LGLKKLGLTWDCQTKVSMVNKEMISMMKDCGCLKIAYGVESGSPKILKLMKWYLYTKEVVLCIRCMEVFHSKKVITSLFLKEPCIKFILTIKKTGYL